MAVGFPTKANWAAGDVLTASAQDDLAGTVNLLSNASAASGTQLLSNAAGTSFAYQPVIAGGKNFCINGGFDIWQRGTTFSSPAAYTYTADRWQVVGNGGTYTISQDTTTIQDGSTYSLKITTAAASSFANMSSVLESNTVNMLAGKTITFSASAKVNATFSGTVNLSIDTNTSADTASGGTWTNGAIVNFTPTTSGWVKGTVTYAVPSGTKGLRVSLNFNSVQASGAIIYWNQAQLEMGTIPTAFSRAGGTYQGELAACQRYYWRVGANSARLFPYTPSANTTNCYMTIVPKVTMRTINAIEYASLQIYDGYNVITVSSIGTDINDGNTPSLNVVGVGLTQYRPYTLLAGSTGYFGLSAEL